MSGGSGYELEKSGGLGWILGGAILLGLAAIFWFALSTPDTQPSGPIPTSRVEVVR